jgi:hypothetical protein
VIYTFIEKEKSNHRISRMCRLLKVSKSGFYSWRCRAPSARADTLLSEKIARIHADSRQTYGAPRLHFELRMLGVRCARKRIARLMREVGLLGCGGRRRRIRTTLGSQTERTAPHPIWCGATSLPKIRIACGLPHITYVKVGPVPYEQLVPVQLFGAPVRTTAPPLTTAES